MWQSTVASRFLDELPPDHVEIAEASSNYGGYAGGGYGPSRFDSHDPFEKGNYSTPDWKRAQRARQRSEGFFDGGGRGQQSARTKRPGR